MRVGAVIPAHNEEASIGRVVSGIPRDLVEVVVVGANCCTDNTVAAARAAGAVIAEENRKGYGWACRAAIDLLPFEIDTLVFLDGDFADDPVEIPCLLRPLEEGADLVLGSRVLGIRQAGALSLQSRFGNWIAVHMIWRLFGHRYSDLGPFRAMRRETFERLQLREYTFGWTVEQQVKALILGLVVVEVPVSYRRRIGHSKVSGTLAGVLGAGVGILGTIFRIWWRERHTLRRRRARLEP